MYTNRRRRGDAVRGAFLAIFLLSGGSSYAQTGSPAAHTPSGSLQKGSVEVGAIFGTTLPVTWLRAHSDRHITMASLDVGRVVTNELGRGPLAGCFEFLIELTPVMVVQQPSRTFGVTVSPLHMRWNFAPIARHRVRPFAEASGGMVYTSAPVPVRATTSFNFIDQAGFGLRFEGRAQWGWLAGYRFQHISNAGRVEPNPGANFNFAYVAVTFKR